MKVIKDGKTFTLNGGDTWTERRFKDLKEQNPKGKVCILDEQKERSVVLIGELEIKQEPINF